jgi:prepilin-type processing-associated H-X9-DG protein
MKNLTPNIHQEKRVRPVSSFTAAFTLIELLTIIAMVAILYALLLPGLSHAKSQTRLSSCMGNFHQWVVSAGMYAADNRERLPTYANLAYGENIRDTSTAFPTNMVAYGLNQPGMWFCPFRPDEIKAANIPGANGYIGRPIVTMNDAMQYMYSRYGIGGLTLLFDNWWVPRQGSGALGDPAANTLFPKRQTGFTNTSPTGFDWPMTTSDRSASSVPIVSDVCSSLTAGDKNVNHIDPTSAHFVDGKLDSVNAGYVDGHVETRRPNAIAARWAAGAAGFAGGLIWFY